MPRKRRIKIKHRQHLSQSENIHQWQPWTRSTGPKTPEGKAKVAKNLPPHPCEQWRNICKILELDAESTTKIDVQITPAISEQLCEKPGFMPNVPVRFRARLSKDKSRILGKSFEQNYCANDRGEVMPSSEKIRRMLSSF